MTVGKAIYNLLLSNADLRAIVDTRIFPEVAQQDAVLPYVVYNVSSNEPSDTKREPSKLDTAQIEVNLYSTSYTECIDMATHTRAALDRVRGTYSGVNVQSIQYLGEIIDFDEAQRTYNITADYDVRISRSDFEIAQGSPITGVKLGELSDVDISGVSDGQFIKYVAAQQEWQAADSTGGVTTLAALTDVNLTGLGNKDVINYNSTTGEWEPVDFLDVLYTNLKTGVSTTINDGANTNSALELGATTAKLKTGISEILITETSPGDIDFIVATDGSGTTAYTALNIDGSTSANAAILNIPVGTQLHIKSATHYAYLRYTGGANASLSLPTSSGTLARLADIALDSAVAANTAKISYTDASAVAANTAKVGITTQQASDITTNNAKTGITSGQASAITANTAKISYTDASAVAANTAKNSYPSSDALKLAGIAAGAEVNTVDNVAGGTGLTASPTTGSVVLNLDDTAVTAGSYTAADITIDAQGRITAAANGSGGGGGVTAVTGTAPITSSGGNTPDIAITAATTSAAGSMSSADKTKLDNITTNYATNALNTGQNILMTATISVADDKIVDVMGDALAARDNANSKKLIGFHTGSNEVVLQGMVDAGGAISGSAAGAPLWLGASGTFSATAPTTADEYSRVVGYYIGAIGSAYAVYFDPSKDWVQIDS